MPRLIAVAKFLVSNSLFFSSDLGKLAKPSYQMVLERALGNRDQSSPILVSNLCKNKRVQANL